MELVQVSYIAEIIAAILVIVSLVYVGVQVRQKHRGRHFVCVEDVLCWRAEILNCFWFGGVWIMFVQTDVVKDLIDEACLVIVKYDELALLVIRMLRKS